jgi:hypothetical protein
MIFPVKIAWRARFPAGGLASNILPKELPVLRVHHPFPFLHVRNGSMLLKKSATNDERAIFES